MRLVLATNNQGKVDELQELLKPHGFEVVSLASYPNLPEVEENGTTFEENAIKKAKEIAAATGELTMADDSGLEVDYLDGAPGVHSARFAGEHGNNEANNQKLLELLNGVPQEKRTARFRCVVAVATADGDVKTAEGFCEGIIIDEPRGKRGFGYDPLFYYPQEGKTFAELDRNIKNQISHRGKALAAIKDYLAGLARGV